MSALFLIIIPIIIGCAIYYTNKKFHWFKNSSKFILGLGLAIVLAITIFLFVLALIIILNKIEFYEIVTILGITTTFIGASQLVYTIPLILLLIRNKQYHMMAGVITGAVLIALLNIGCYETLIFNIWEIGG